MHPRIHISKFLLRLGDFLQTLPVAVMKPDDLIAFSQGTYADARQVENWADDALVDKGLAAEENHLLRDVTDKNGELLLLGLGGGREAIALAKMGFLVTGVDFIEELVKRAIEKAAAREVKINGIVQEISRLDVPPNSYNLVWISKGMYSCIPTRKRRVEMVKRISMALKPGGFLICQYCTDSEKQASGTGHFLRRLIAIGTLGNFDYQRGDILWLKSEFLHLFQNECEIVSELKEGGLSIIRIQTSQHPFRYAAICRKVL